jgi:8-oxo-dGTP pyrophosphatase MutT (NUDIX family)
MNEVELRAKLPPGLAHNRLSLENNRPAAVLVPLEPERGVWLTRRSARMVNHAGQVSFPGGKVDLGDASVEDAARREAWEEIGLDPASVEILGRLDDHITGTGFHIAPVVALVPRGVALHVASDEVVEVFCLPFEMLLDRSLPHVRRALIDGVERSFSVWPHERHVVWGATGEILRKLAVQLRGDG